MDTITAEDGKVFRHKKTKQMVGKVVNLRSNEKESDFEQVDAPKTPKEFCFLIRGLARRKHGV